MLIEIKIIIFGGADFGNGDFCGKILRKAKRYFLKEKGSIDENTEKR